MEMERRTGVLLAVNEAEGARFSVKDGRLLKVELSDATADLKSTELAFEVLSWKRGQFEFALQDVACQDELGMGTTALLLEHARRVDETHR